MEISALQDELDELKGESKSRTESEASMGEAGDKIGAWGTADKAGTRSENPIPSLPNHPGFKFPRSTRVYMMGLGFRVYRV
jgi:hypothetical protein